MNAGTVYVIGAGLAGLSCAVKLAQQGARVTLLEAAGHAGGRCRSYFDAGLSQVIDNGNHLLLSGNHATHEYLRAIGAADKLAGPETASFAFADLRNGKRWTIALNDGRVPWWLLDKTRRAPGSSILEHVRVAKLLAAPAQKRVDEVIDCHGPLWETLLHPLLLAGLNIEPEAGSAGLAAALLRETIVAGGAACRPRVASPNLNAAFVEPALSYLNGHGASMIFGARLRRVEFDGEQAQALLFDQIQIAIDPHDRVVLATPSWVTQELMPEVAAPNEYRAILNAHFVAAAPPGAPLMTGVIGGTAEWVFAFPDRLSVTVSAADRLINRDRAALAELLWRDVASLYGLAAPLPRWQIVKERRATFAATPEQAQRRAGAGTRWANLFLAGDWTDTGLPATIEGAVRSGHKAADLAGKAGSV
jgi:squalene-associated FAD-dependent desaturase